MKAIHRYLEKKTQSSESKLPDEGAFKKLFKTNISRAMFPLVKVMTQSQLYEIGILRLHVEIILECVKFPIQYFALCFLYCSYLFLRGEHLF